MIQNTKKDFRKAFVLPLSLAISFIVFSFSVFLLKATGLLIDIREAMKKKVDLTAEMYSFINYLNYNLLTATYDCKSVYIDNYRIPLNGKQEKIKWPYLKDIEITIEIKDGNTFLLSRGLTEEVLRSILGEDEKSLSFIQSILDWFDKNDASRPYGAECEYYKNNGYSFCPRNSRAIQYKDELKDVKAGYLFSRLSDYISDYSENKINLNTANVNFIKSLSGVDISFFRKENECISWKQLDDLPLRNREIFTVVPGKYLHIFVCLNYKSNPYIKVCSSYVLDRSMDHNVPIREFSIR